ncbi:CPBP family intramembrane glutamic endopeptidase [Nocardioides ferulae]|uniref:CPBP family intramembrane glutamic endopeptidase n=1 Tax=Nocardioides ferulae TaxID=2340821 RepID=UPI0013DE6D1E|nr:type II CAAX endopeptidase family protein [Nocardioides ferulae]
MLASPSAGLAYHELFRAGRGSRWWSILGVFTLLALMVVVIPIGLTVVFLVGYAVAGSDVGAALDRLVDLDDPTPVSLAYLNLSLAAAIPVVLGLVWLLHALRPGWASSVRGRLRWGWLATCFALAFAALVVTVLVSALLPAQGADTSMDGGLNDFTTTTRDFALVVLLLTPLQAAGEEYAFRGYLTQAFGGLLGSRWVAVLGPALLFALAHGAQDLPVFFDRFAFGVVSGILVIATGGLEAGIAMHVLNNWLAFGLALAFGDMASTLNPTGGSWWSIPVTLTQSLAFLGLTLLVARRMGVESRTGEPVLVARNPPV